MMFPGADWAVAGGKNEGPMGGDRVAGRMPGSGRTGAGEEDSSRNIRNKGKDFQPMEGHTVHVNM